MEHQIMSGLVSHDQLRNSMIHASPVALVFADLGPREFVVRQVTLSLHGRCWIVGYDAKTKKKITGVGTVPIHDNFYSADVCR